MLPIFAAILSLAQAQDTVRLTFPQALERARRSNPEFVNERLDYENSVIELASEKAERYYPELALRFVVPQYVSKIERDRQGGQIVFDRTESRTLETELELEQPLPTGGVFRLTGTVTGVGQPIADADSRYSAASFLGFQLEQQVFGINESVRDYRLAREDFARSAAEFADEERNLAGEVMEAYYSLVQALKQAQIDSVVFVRDSIRNAAAPERRARQITNEVDSLKFLIEVTRSALNRSESDDEVSEARTELNELLALPAQTIVIPDSAVTVERIVPDIAAGLASARANRQDLRLAELGVENREAGLRDAHRTSPVTLFIESEIGFDGAADAGAARRALRDAITNQNRSRTLDLGVRIPLFDRFQERHAVAQARNDLRGAEVNLADEQRQIENEVRNAARSVNNATRRLDLAEREFALTQQTLQIQMRRFGAGEIPIVEFLLDQTAAREAEIGLIEAQVDMLTAIEEWRRAIGERSGLVGSGGTG
jgi:outer membrane protein TolC